MNEQFYVDKNQLSSMSLCMSGHSETVAGHKYGPAVRTYYLLHFVVKGKGVYEVNDQKYQIAPGQGFFIEPFATTVYTADCENPWEYYWFGFYGTESEKILQLLGISGESPVFNFKNVELLRETYKRFSRDYIKEPDNHLAFLGHLYTALSLIERNSVVETEGVVQQVKEYIQENYAENLSVEEIAAKFKINRSYLFRIFKQATGNSIIKYLVDYRISRAKDFLLLRQMNITEVAYACGFSSSSYFSNIFKEKVGCTPREFQKKLDEDPTAVNFIGED